MGVMGTDGSYGRGERGQWGSNTVAGNPCGITPL